jgi:carbon monoxide dehydrogenase subunit G
MDFRRFVGARRRAGVTSKFQLAGESVMASIHKEIAIAAPPDAVWAAVRDVGAVHQRLVPGFVTDTRMEEGARIVTFANGMVVRELIVDIDDAARRLAYASVGGRAAHHHASMQVFADAGGSRLVWITDVLPDALLEPIRANVEHGSAIIKQTLERDAAVR